MKILNSFVGVSASPTRPGARHNKGRLKIKGYQQGQKCAENFVLSIIKI
jgi:hypothetical protein